MIQPDHECEAEYESVTRGIGHSFIMHDIVQIVKWPPRCSICGKFMIWDNVDLRLKR